MRKRHSTLRSSFEDSIKEDLDKQKATYEYETEKLEYTCMYLPDCIIYSKGGKKIYVEAKGYFDPDSIKKMIAVFREHPEKDIRMVFQNGSNKIRKGSKTTYGDWCEKRGIKWAQKRIPTEWLDE